MSMNRNSKSMQGAAGGRTDAAQNAPTAEMRQFDIRDLLGDAREAVLIHGGERYRLRITMNDKLILTK